VDNDMAMEYGTEKGIPRKRWFQDVKDNLR
jgi:hypothetical protein